jgi:hypothetical protein
MTTATSYFLIVYRLDERTAEVEDFGADEAAAATAYSEREHEHGDAMDVEVVLLGADSLETVRKTHSHYFVGTGDLIAAVERDLVAVSPAG